MAGRKPTPINLKSTSPEGVVRTFKSIPEAARELGFSEAGVKKAKYSNRNRIGEYQLEWLEPKPEKPAFNRLERVKSNKTNNCFICEEPLETEDKMDHFSIEELNSKGEIIQTHYPHSLYRASQISGISWNTLKNKTNDLILNLAPENVTQHSRIVTTTCKGSSTPTKMSKIIGRQIH